MLELNKSLLVISILSVYSQYQWKLVAVELAANGTTESAYEYCDDGQAPEFNGTIENVESSKYQLGDYDDFDDCENSTTTNIDDDADKQIVGYHYNLARRQHHHHQQQQQLQPNQLDIISTNQEDDCISTHGWPCKYMHTCGQAPLNHFGGYLITSGEKAWPGQWPFYAAIYFDKIFICGGSIVSAYHIITAGACIDKALQINRPQALEVLIGTNVHLESISDTVRLLVEPGFELIQVKQIIRHPNEDRDQGWLVLVREIEFNNFVQPICYPYDHLERVPFDGDHHCYAIGKGRDNDIASNNKHPKSIKHLRVAYKYCSGMQAGDNCYEVVKHDGIMATGDTGNPIACMNSNDSRWHLNGLHFSSKSRSLGVKAWRGVMTTPDTAFAKLTSYWPIIHRCNENIVGSTICKAQPRCDHHHQPTGQLRQAQTYQPYMVRIDKLAHDAMRHGGSPCPGVLVSNDLVLTDRNCTLARYIKPNIWDIAPLNSLHVSLNIYETQRPGIISTTGVSNMTDLKLKVDEIYVLRKFMRDLILLRLDSELDKGNSPVMKSKHPICWPLDFTSILWDRCNLIRFVEPNFSIAYEVNKIGCHEQQKAPETILSCWIFKDASVNKEVKNSRTPWIAGSPIVCGNKHEKNVLVAIIKASHRTWAMAASVQAEDIKVQNWWREIMRGRSPKASTEF